MPAAPGRLTDQWPRPVLHNQPVQRHSARGSIPRRQRGRPGSAQPGRDPRQLGSGDRHRSAPGSTHDRSMLNALQVQLEHDAGGRLELRGTPPRQAGGTCLPAARDIHPLDVPTAPGTTRQTARPHQEECQSKIKPSRRLSITEACSGWAGRSRLNRRRSHRRQWPEVKAFQSHTALRCLYRRCYGAHGITPLARPAATSVSALTIHPGYARNNHDDERRRRDPTHGDLLRVIRGDAPIVASSERHAIRGGHGLRLRPARTRLTVRRNSWRTTMWPSKASGLRRQRLSPDESALARRRIALV